MVELQRTPNLAALFDARVRLDLALAVIPTIHRLQRERLLAWFDLMVRDTLSPAEPVQLSVIAPWHRQRVGWRVATERRLLMSPLTEYLQALGTTELELSAVRKLGDMVDIEQMGAWLEAGQHGLETGWFCPEPMELERALELAPDTHDRLAVHVWAKEYGIDRCLSCAHSVHPANPWTEICVELPGAELLDQLCAARVIYKALSMPVPDNDTYSALLRAGTSDLLLVLGLSAVGPVRIGIAAPRPTYDGTVQLARIGAKADHETSAEGVEALRRTLGVSSPPDTVTWLRDATGICVELLFAVPIRASDGY